MPSTFYSLTGERPLQRVVDVGAANINGTPQYAPLLKYENCHLVGFEPSKESFEALLRLDRPNATYLQCAIGDGKPHTLHVCASAGMTSLLEPNPEILSLFHGFPLWGNVVAREQIETCRLDDIPETEGVTFLEMDIQGAELLALTHATKCFESVSVLHIEVEFLPMYKNQPLFSEVEIFLRRRGFWLHRFSPIVTRVFAPMMVNNSIYGGLNQLVWADAVFVRDFTRLDSQTSEQLLSGAAILHDCYQSYDLTLKLLIEHDKRTGKKLADGYLGRLTRGNASEAPVGSG